MSQSEYDAATVAKVLEVMAETFRALGEYHDHMVLVGGWVPQLLIAKPNEPHCGSLDVDIALDHTAIDDYCYRRISELLAGLAFIVDERNRYRFTRNVEVDGRQIAVAIDLLAAEYGGRVASHRHQHVQDVEARKARGADLAFVHPVRVTAEMRLPNGAKADVTLLVAGVAVFLVMKAFAMVGRRKDKDAYDIAYCLENYPGGVEAVARDFVQYGDHGLVREAIELLKSEFKAVEYVGPVAVANFRELPPGEERELCARRAFELVQELIKQVEAQFPRGHAMD